MERDQIAGYVTVAVPVVVLAVDIWWLVVIELTLKRNVDRCHKFTKRIPISHVEAAENIVFDYHSPLIYYSLRDPIYCVVCKSTALDDCCHSLFYIAIDIGSARELKFSSIDGTDAL